jgi:2-amino-4-hydroxy-6-hydroxymethyldihydropteridine diphosphokinase
MGTLMAMVYFGLGTNIGDRMANLKAAVAALDQITQIQACSRVYETAPVHVLDQPAFFNMAVRARSPLPPHELLAAIKAIETRLGRTEGLRYGPRLIDIDILLLGDLVMDDDTLTIPHPRLAERRFALAPLADIGATAIHPQEHRSIAELLAALPDKDDDIRTIGEWQ